jgi:hypothetical protein
LHGLRRQGLENRFSQSDSLYKKINFLKKVRKIVNWLGVYGPLPIVIMEHATQFCNVFGKETGM